MAREMDEMKERTKRKKSMETRKEGKKHGDKRKQCRREWRLVETNLRGKVIKALRIN